MAIGGSIVLLAGLSVDMLQQATRSPDCAFWVQQLHQSASGGSLSGIRAAVENLRRRNINVNAKDSEGRTAAYLAAASRQPSAARIIKLLHDNGADLTEPMEGTGEMELVGPLFIASYLGEASQLKPALSSAAPPLTLAGVSTGRWREGISRITVSGRARRGRGGPAYRALPRGAVPGRDRVPFV